MFYHKLTDGFARGVREASPYPRGEIGANRASRGGPAKIGAALMLGAAVFGGVLAAANVKMQQEAPAQMAAAPEPVATPAPSVAVADAKVPPPPVAPAPVEAAKSPAPATVKPTTPVDMAATGAIAEEPAKKLHPQPHPKVKKKPAAKAQ